MKETVIEIDGGRDLEKGIVHLDVLDPHRLIVARHPLPPFPPDQDLLGILLPLDDSLRKRDHTLQHMPPFPTADHQCQSIAHPRITDLFRWYRLKDMIENHLLYRDYRLADQRANVLDQVYQVYQYLRDQEHCQEVLFNHFLSQIQILISWQHLSKTKNHHLPLLKWKTRSIHMRNLRFQHLEVDYLGLSGRISHPTRLLDLMGDLLLDQVSIHIDRSSPNPNILQTPFA